MANIGQNFSSDFSIEQNWQDYNEEEHAVWRVLFERQQRLLVGRACPEFLDGLGALGVAAEGIPPTSHAVPLVNVFRDDVEWPCLGAEKALDQAPAVEQQRFRVPRILAED